MRAILHGATAIYLIRYLNVPPARLPGEADDRLEGLPSTIEDIRASLLDTFDRQHQVEVMACLVARHLTLGHPPELIISALARALLREDAGFHAYQILEINRDIVAHTATVRGGFDVMIEANKSASLILTKAGIVEYYCRLHPNIKGRITITPE